jgi:hypothetical protein
MTLSLEIFCSERKNFDMKFVRKVKNWTVNKEQFKVNNNNIALCSNWGIPHKVMCSLCL